MAPATSTAGASSRSRRLRLALFLVLWLLPCAGAASDGDTSSVYIWRDAHGAIRFSVPAPPR